MKKKTYEQPQMRIVEVKATDIICTSQATFSLNDDDTIEQGLESDWGDNLDW